jgi:predicted SAM-dependent methyltransferase
LPIKYFSLKENNQLTLNIGSKESRFSDVNVDLQINPNLDVCASALNLPFKEAVFREVFFTEVMEHLPLGSEKKALTEIHRVLGFNGQLVMSVPNDFGVWKFFDPAFYLEKHRHYRRKTVLRLMKDAGLKIVQVFTSGGLWEILSNLIYCFWFYPAKRLLGYNLDVRGFPLPRYIDKKVQAEFKKIKGEDGTNLFVIATKNGS